MKKRRKMAGNAGKILLAIKEKILYTSRKVVKKRAREHVLSQSETAGSSVSAGTVITVQLGDTSVKD